MLGLISAYRAQGRGKDADLLAGKLLQRLPRQEAKRRTPKPDSFFLDGYFALMGELGMLAMYQELGHFHEAEKHLQPEAAKSSELSQKDPKRARMLDVLAMRYAELGATDLALSYSRKASLAIEESEIAFADSRKLAVAMRSVSIKPADDRLLSSSALPSFSRAEDFVRDFATLSPQLPSEYFLHHLSNLSAAAGRKRGMTTLLGPEALDIAQRASQSTAAAALIQTAARFASSSNKLATLVRENQDLGMLWHDQNDHFLEMLSQQERPDENVLRKMREKIAETETRFAVVANQIDNEFPGYAALVTPKPLKVREVQDLIGSEEAMTFFIEGRGELHVFALTRDRFDWRTIPVSVEALSKKVAAFRQGLDLNKITGRSDASGKPALFDLRVANELYVSLFGPVETLIRGKKHLLIVPTGALTALPFDLLVTTRPAVAIPREFSGYRDAAWLIKRQAVSVLPSVASLKALRGFERKDPGTKPMTGFGDPVFDFSKAVPGGLRTAESTVRSLTTNSYTDFWQGAGVDRSKLAQALPPLPDTADELNAVALALGAPAADIHLGLDASETAVKHASLADYRVVYFATHGLVAGDVKGLGEPSLALSLPKQPSEFDDGLLTSSEIAQLKLNADWVVLSACNTIAGDKPGAEALSGLARSFFYAGARALLVSHWAVDSEAATKLAIATFDRLKSDPKLGRAEALRQAMLGYLNDTSSPRNAYPALWGPFALIGEGAAR
jgi:CHAT domain-containing protein